ncbi:hypothetical protein MWS69_002689 [Citrobacter amalonaticus]|nr:hypothetical protein [Citrobacter amalonaticus]
MSEKAYFSPSKLSFFPENMVIDGTFSEENGNLPTDAVLLSEEQTAMFWRATPPDGMTLGQIDGLPAWVEIPTKSNGELYKEELSSINQAYNSDKIILRDAYLNAMLFDGPTEQDKKTAIYNKLVSRNLQYAADLDALDVKYGG